MSQHHTESNPNPMGMGCALGLLGLVFIILGGLLANVDRTSFARAASTATNTQVATEVAVLPTHTVVPPTETLVPTVFPTATFTLIPTLPPPTTTEPVVETGGGGTTASGYDPALVARGETLFAQCAACHGVDARGVPNLGKNLVESEFVASLTDDELLTFITTGRPMWDPANTTGIDMPPRGGNPALTDDDVLAIIAYLRSISEVGG